MCHLHLAHMCTIGSLAHAVAPMRALAWDLVYHLLRVIFPTLALAVAYRPNHAIS